jgi:hypothetical protein
MLLSVISRAHRGAEIGWQRISLLGRWRSEIRVAPRSGRRGPEGPGRGDRLPWLACGARPGPAGREVPEGPDVPRAEGRRSWPPRARRLGPNAVLIVPFTRPDKWIADWPLNGA